MTSLLSPAVGQRTQIAAVLLLGLLAFYVLGLDQGLVLSLIQGDVAYAQNLIHEALHDARHAAGFACH